VNVDERTSGAALEEARRDVGVTNFEKLLRVALASLSAPAR